MPELPEVETVRRDLEAQLINKKIKSIEVLNPGTVGGNPLKLSEALSSTSFTDISRRGKLLIFKSSHPDLFLLVHLKMTGQLIYLFKNQIAAGGHSLSSHSFEKAVGGELPNKHTRVIITFKDSSRLFFNDLRKFGYMRLASKEELNKIVTNNYGPEPLGKLFILSDFSARLKKRHISIKAALLDQKMVAGLGNIYVDEVLYEAGVRPMRLASSVKEAEIAKIYKAIKRILTLAIKNRGTTFSNYVDGSGHKGNFSKKLQVYGHGNSPCPQCGLAIIKTKIAGRGTHYCVHCQS
jgi:formamidopyrimidine-DNA glycosylase